jgi:hypothetical protein
MWKRMQRGIFFFSSVALLFLWAAGATWGQAGVVTHLGTLPDGATFLIEVPANWNGTLFLYSHGYVVPGSSNPAQDVVDQAGNGRFLRRAFVDRAGHCAFTPAETIAAVQTLINRLDSGKWHNVDANDLNSAAATLGPRFNIFSTPQGVVAAPPAYIEFDPSRYLRPFDALAGECEFGFQCGDRFMHFDLR